MAGRLGLKLGAIPECPGDEILGMAIMGGWDWGPCGEGRSASSEVASSICLWRRGAFARCIFYAIPIALPVISHDFVCHLLQGQRGNLFRDVGPVKQEDKEPKPDEEREEGARLGNGCGDTLSCDEGHYLLASKFSDSGSAVHGTSSDTNRTHPVST